MGGGEGGLEQAGRAGRAGGGKHEPRASRAAAAKRWDRTSVSPVIAGSLSGRAGSRSGQRGRERDARLWERGLTERGGERERCRQQVRRERGSAGGDDPVAGSTFGPKPPPNSHPHPTFDFGRARASRVARCRSARALAQPPNPRQPSLPLAANPHPPPPPTMRIEELILEGFKSYPVRTTITGWDESFNVRPPPPLPFPPSSLDPRRLSRRSPSLVADVADLDSSPSRLLRRLSPVSTDPVRAASRPASGLPARPLPSDPSDGLTSPLSPLPTPQASPTSSTPSASSSASPT